MIMEWRSHGGRPWHGFSPERDAFQDSAQLDVTPVQVVLTHGTGLRHGVSMDERHLRTLPRLHLLTRKRTCADPLRPRCTWYEHPLPHPLLDLVPGEMISCGDLALEIRFVPGHAPGHVALVCREHGWVLGGDVLFQGSIGRTDLPGSVPRDLRESIEREMYTLPDDMVVWPGHGGSTTIGAEKRSNPFVNASGTGLLQREAEG